MWSFVEWVKLHTVWKNHNLAILEAWNCHLSIIETFFHIKIYLNSEPLKCTGRISAFPAGTRNGFELNSHGKRVKENCGKIKKNWAKNMAKIDQKLVKRIDFFRDHFTEIFYQLIIRWYMHLKEIWYLFFKRIQSWVYFLAFFLHENNFFYCKTVPAGNEKGANVASLL